MADIWDRIGAMGAGFSGNLPQYTYALQQEQEQAFLADERRRKALIRDFAQVYSLGSAGQWDQAGKLLDNRIPLIQKLGGDPSDSIALRDRIRSGKYDEVKAELGAFMQAAQLAGEFGGDPANAQKGQSFPMMGPDGQMVLVGSVFDPRTQQWSAQQVPLTGEIVGASGVAPSQRPAQRYAETAAEEQARLGYERPRAMEATTGANLGASGMGGGPSNADLAAERAAAEARAKAEAESKARTVKATQIYTPFSTQLTALRDAYKGTGTGPLVGRFSGYTSSSQKAQAARDIMSPMLKQVVRDAGEGTFAKNDQDQIDAMMPKETDLPEVVDYKIGLMDTFVRGKLGVPLDTPSPVNQNANPMEGKTAVNPQTGEKIIMRNGQWVPM